MGGFFRDFEAIRTASRPRCPAQEGPNEEEESDEEEPLDPLPENALQPLKPCRAGKNIDLDEDKEKELEQSDADPLVAMLFRDTDEDAPFFGACFCEDGSLRLPGLEGDGAIVDEEGARPRRPLLPRTCALLPPPRHRVDGVEASRDATTPRHRRISPIYHRAGSRRTCCGGDDGRRGAAAAARGRSD